MSTNNKVSAITQNTSNKIAFLFLTINDLNNGLLWEKFFNGNEQKFNIYSHSKNQSNLTQKLLIDSQIKNRVDTTWGDISLVRATNNLLKEAYDNSDNKFFMLLSESCIPLYDFNFIYDLILNNNKSSLFYYDWSNTVNSNNRRNKLKNIKFEHFYKQSQWMLLTRDHVKCILDHDLTTNFEKVTAADEHYYINILKTFHNNFDFENINYPITFVNWLDKNNGHPYVYKILNLSDARKLNGKEFYSNITPVNDDSSISLFLRKASKEINIFDNNNFLNRTNAIRALNECTNIITRNNGKYWISCGTLLGAIRDGDFISHDNDIDLCIEAQSFNYNIINNLLKNQFIIIRKYGLLKDGFELTIKKYNIKIDLFFFYKTDDRWYHSVYSDITKTDALKYDYVFKPFQLTKIKFLGYEFFAPDNPKDYLSQQYGDDYMTPNPNWCYYKSPKNITKTDIRIKTMDTENDFNYLINPTKTEKFYDTTLLIKSFLRKDCVENLIKSIRQKYKTIKIVVVDDSNPPLNFDAYPNVTTYNLPFDSGLSYSQNYGVSMIDTKYFILLDDDFIFTDKTDLDKFIQIFENSQLDVLGGYVMENGKPNMYFGNFEYNKEKSIIITNDQYKNFGDYNVCHLILNFFIAKTDKIKEFGWDNELKLSEHTAFFFTHRDKLKVGFTNKVSINHLRVRNADYNQYRNRGDEFFKKWLSKNNFKLFITRNGRQYTP